MEATTVEAWVNRATAAKLVEGPGVLASHVTPQNTAQARELAREIEQLRADAARVEGLLSEIRTGVAGFDAQVPRNLSVLADALLTGGPVPTVAPSANGPVPRAELEVRRTALELKRNDLERTIAERTFELKRAVQDILAAATMSAANDLADLVRDRVAALHVAVDAGHSLHPRIANEPLPNAWRREKLLAPPGLDRSKFAREDLWSEAHLVDFSSGAGIPGEVEAFRRAVKTLVGICPV